MDVCPVKVWKQSSNGNRQEDCPAPVTYVTTTKYSDFVQQCMYFQN